jgi:isoquinoline 1-oxidoreductase beta subunit
MAAKLNRRQFLKTTTGVTFAIGAGGIISACARDESAAPVANADPFNPNIWVTINPDNSIIVEYASTEMGQGSSTHTPMILAEYLDADWDNVVVHTVQVHDEAYGNPIFRNILYTAGSTTILVYKDKMKTAGAQARKMLMAAAANAWQVPVTEVDTDIGLVKHAASDRSASYGDIVGTMDLPAEVPEVSEADFIPDSEFRYIGKDLMRRDVPDKSSGRAIYGQDIQIPGMVYAAVQHAPVEGERALNVDDAEALEVDGVTEVVILPHAVAVVGTTVEGTQSGKRKLNIEWSNESPFRNSTSADTIEQYTKLVTDLSLSGTVWNETGDIKAALENAETVIDAVYTSDTVNHAQMEPMNATASVSDDGLSAEIWVGTQTQSLTIIGSAETLGTSNDKITLHPLTMGGGFGRRTELHQEYVDDALLISREIKKPVKVIWTREDDIQTGLFRPAVAQYLRGGFDESGKLVAVHHRVGTSNILPTMNRHRWEWAKPKDVIVMLGSESTTYDIPNHQAEHIAGERKSRVLAWRGISTSYTKFAVESFVDELAATQHTDPLEFRLALCHDNPRMTDVLNTVAEMADWSRPRPDGRALGIAVSGYSSSLSAGIIEISLDENTGVVKVHNVWAVGDCGYVMSPKNATAQLDGNVIFGLSSVLKERITIRNGAVEQSNFHDYPLLRITEIPEIESRVMRNNHKSTGAGELGTAMIGPAIANALYTLTGKRFRHLPLTPEVVRQALHS